jgi:hypothetical protein
MIIYNILSYIIIILLYVIILNSNSTGLFYKLMHPK